MPASKPELNKLRQQLLQHATQDRSLFRLTSRSEFTLDPEPFASGGMAEIYRCELKGKICAAKTLFRDKDKIPASALSDLHKEIQFLAALQHPYILGLLGTCFEDESSPILLMEMCKMDLEKRVIQAYIQDASKRVELTDTNKLKYALQLALAIEHLVENGCIHRDLKPSNVFISMDDTVKLADFGLAKYIGNEACDTTGRRMTGETGSYRFMAPEVFSHQPAYGFPADVYSFGMVLFYLFSGVRPFYDVADPVKAAREALAQRRPFIQAVDTPSVRPLIQRCWHAVPAQRPTMAHNVRELISQLEEATAAPIKHKSFAAALYSALFDSEE